MSSMKTDRRSALAGIAAVAGVAATRGLAAETKEAPMRSAAFHLDDLALENAKTESPWHQFFDNNTMFAGLYEVPAGGEDRQSPHQQDELYFVTRGKATLQAGENAYPARPGSIFFVKATVPHRFVEVAEDLQVLVFFSKADPNGG